VIIGHPKIIQFLNKSIANDKLAHAYLFIGSEHLGKRTLALEFAKALQCQKGARELSVDAITDFQISFCGQCRSCQEIAKNSHPDVLLIEPEVIETNGKVKELEIGIGKIREIRRLVSLFPYYGPYKIVIINQADKLSREAANAFLKTLEEPTLKTIMLLISSSYQNLLPTIVSRCLPIKFLSVSDREIKEHLLKQKKITLSDGDLNRILRYAAGRPGVVINYLDHPDLLQEERKMMKDLFDLMGKDLSFKFKYAETLSKDTELASRVLNQWIGVFRDALLFSAGCDSPMIAGDFPEKENHFYGLRQTNNILRKIVETKNLLSNPSFNSRLILESLMLNF
jgi:DNA polymerase-3 subunit delta'